MACIVGTDVTFDKARLLADVEGIEKVCSGSPLQVNLMVRDGWEGTNEEALLYGAGSLYRDEISFDKESNWTRVNPLFEGMYITSIFGEVSDYVQQQYPNTRIARARIMKMAPKTCLSLHRDDDNVVRAHIPITTEYGCMFISHEKVYRMSDVGRLYLFKTNRMHTAINATKRFVRTHLVINFVDK